MTVQFINMMKFTLPPVVCKGQYHSTESIMAIIEHIAITPRAIMGPQWHSLFNSWRFSNLITEQDEPILVRKNVFLSLKNYRLPFSVHTFPCAASPCVFLDCHVFCATLMQIMPRSPFRTQSSLSELWESSILVWNCLKKTKWTRSVKKCIT